MSIDLDFLPDTIKPLNSQATHVGKVDQDLLMQMLEGGKSQKACADHFGVSKSAISQLVSRLTVAPRPEILDRLTPSQERFVFAMADDKNQTQAALDSYNVGSRESASVIGTRLMADPLIQECIQVVMATEGLTRRKMVRRLAEHVDSRDSNASLRAINMGLKLTDSYPAEKRMNLNVNIDAIAPVDLSRYR